MFAVRLSSTGYILKARSKHYWMDGKKEIKLIHFVIK